jgi:hypothetical protein
MKKQINDGFKMWGNYLKAIDDFTKNNDEQFGRFMRIICYYGIYGEEIAETEIEKFFFTSVKSSIDASTKNIRNGKLGGAPKATTTKSNTEEFKEPTLEEIKAYCEERKNGIDPDEFLSHYQRNGWVWGKENKPVKDWKACIRIWERNAKKWETTDTVHNKGEDIL